MTSIDKRIQEHYDNSLKLKQIYMGDDKISYDKGKELQRQQDDEYKKMIFLKNLRKEMMKSGNNFKN